MGEKLDYTKDGITSSRDIVKSHIESYLKKMTKVLFISILALTIAEVIVVILIYNGYFQYYLNMQNGKGVSYNTFIYEVIGHNAILWLIFIIYVLLFKRAKYKTRKILFSVTFMLVTTILCFGHWKYSYLSILYAIPVCVVSPLGKKHSYTLLILSIIICIIYSIFQTATFKTQYNFLIAVVSILSIIVFFFISQIFFSSMTSAIYDVEKYCTLSKDLRIMVHHDSLTGAFSKIALYKDFENANSYSSMAFLDLDNFKDINDSQGHSIGDYILKSLVRCFKVKNESIYRYGGDEFVILSHLKKEAFGKELEEIKNNFVSISNGVLNCKTSFSAGVVDVNPEDNLEVLLKKCDRAMYVAKKSGKNKITIS